MRASLSRPSTRPTTSAVLSRIAAATTRTMLSASAPRAEAFVHGYASAAGLAVLVLHAGRGGRDLDFPN
jgi:hypothetical protein